MLFYRNLLGAALEVAPEPDDARDHRGRARPSRCPGHSIENFTRKSVQIAHVGHLRPAHPPRRRARARAARLGRVRRRGPRRRRRGGPRGAGRRRWTSSTRPRRGSRRSAARTATSWPTAARRCRPSDRSTCQNVVPPTGHHILTTCAGSAGGAGEAHLDPAVLHAHVERVLRCGRRAVADRAVLEAERAAVPRAGDARRRRRTRCPRAAVRPGGCSGPRARR